MVNMSTSINKTNNHFSPDIIEQTQREIYADENQDPGPGTAQPSLLIIGTPMTIEK
jgi:hypothetical protein